MIATTKYPWKGWKPPIRNLSDPDYCEFGCPIGTSARKGSLVAKAVQSIVGALTFGSCPWGRARKRKYGVKPHEKARIVFMDGKRRHRRIKFGIQIEEGKGNRRWMTEDISVGGCFVSALESLPAGSHINIGFQIPGSSRYIEVTGEVKRTHKNGMGVAFTNINDSEKCEIARFVNDFAAL